MQKGEADEVTKAARGVFDGFGKRNVVRCVIYKRGEVDELTKAVKSIFVLFQGQKLSLDMILMLIVDIMYACISNIYLWSIIYTWYIVYR